MVQRFQTIEQLRAWLDSDERRSLLDKSTSLLAGEGTTNVIEAPNTELSPHDMVTEIITVSVKPGMEEAYHALVDRIRQMEARFPGYQGLQLQPPIGRMTDLRARLRANQLVRRSRFQVWPHLPNIPSFGIHRE